MTLFIKQVIELAKRTHAHKSFINMAIKLAKGGRRAFIYSGFQYFPYVYVAQTKYNNPVCRNKNRILPCKRWGNGFLIYVCMSEHLIAII